MGKSHSEFDIKNRKADITHFIVANDDTNGVTRLVNDELAQKLHNARISTSAGVEIDQNKYFGPISFITRLVTQKVVLYLQNLIYLMRVRMESIIHH